MPGCPSGPLLVGALGGEVVGAAGALLGAVMISTVGGRTTSGRIVEVEAYGGPDDPASHAAVRAGRTRRNSAMFGPPGTAYVYRSYGIHWCLNVVAGPEGSPSAVLVRALEPLEGLEVMRGRRGGARALTSGPGRLCEALGVTGAQDGRPLSDPPLVLRSGDPVPGEAVGVSGRIGIRLASDRPWRFFLRGNPHVSRPVH